MTFQKSQSLTLGVELELQLQDPASMDLSPQAPALLALVKAEDKEQIKAEFIRSMVEVCTPICSDMHEVADTLSSICRKAEKLAAQVGTHCFCASLHPFANFIERRISTGARYEELLDDLQLAGRRMITQALHVHVGLSSQQEAIKVCDCIRVWLPVLLALSSSSPYLQGEDTGFASYRINLFGCLPRTGMPDQLGSWNNFKELITTLNQASILNGIKELWWDVRPHPDFGTVEIRICDLPSRFADILAITALIQALVAWLRTQPETPIGLELLKQSRWHASRYGLNGSWISPTSHLPFRKVALELLEILRDTAQDLGSWPYMQEIKRICEHGSSADQQRQLMHKHGDLRAMIDILRHGFWS